MARKFSPRNFGGLAFWVVGASSQRVVKITVMSLLKYFQLSNSMLPKADGPLSQVIPSSSITAPNKEVKQVHDQSNKPEEKRKRGAYEHFTAAFLLAR